MRELIQRYRRLFSITLRKEPAKVKPMKLDVNNNKWRARSNQRPPRPQTPTKELALRKHILKLLDTGVIVDSKAEY